MCRYTLSLTAFILMWVFQSCVPIKALRISDQYHSEGYRLVWNDEFNESGKPDAANWTYEEGFVRNEELQWYQRDNAFVENGKLVIIAKADKRPNPAYAKGSKNWRTGRESIEYTSACLITRDLHAFQYGRFEMSGKIDISSGLWPAFWTLGVTQKWPANGEIDIMEYYQGKLLANIACKGINGKPKWFSNSIAVNSLGGKSWASEFHVWRMDWDETAISLYIDGRLLNHTSLSSLNNETTSGIHPFRQKHYLLIDLALGGMNGGDLKDTSFPRRFEIDYVRVYQK